MITCLTTMKTNLLQPTPTTLKQTVTESLRETWRGQLPEALIRRTIEEAEETARGTGFPQLFFPVLAEERVRSVHTAVHVDFSQYAA